MIERIPGSSGGPESFFVLGSTNFDRLRDPRALQSREHERYGDRCEHKHNETGEQPRGDSTSLDTSPVSEAIGRLFQVVRLERTPRKPEQRERGYGSEVPREPAEHGRASSRKRYKDEKSYCNREVHQRSRDPGASRPRLVRHDQSGKSTRPRARPGHVA